MDGWGGWMGWRRKVIFYLFLCCCVVMFGLIYRLIYWWVYGFLFKLRIMQDHVFVLLMSTISTIPHPYINPHLTTWLAYTQHIHINSYKIYAILLTLPHYNSSSDILLIQSISYLLFLLLLCLVVQTYFEDF